jgi:ABC-type transport system substrate-binding protein
MVRSRLLARLVLALAAVSLLAASCGSSSPKKAAEVKVNPTGVMRVAASLIATTVYFDLTTQVATPLAYHNMIYDTLLRPTPSGVPEPGLAKKATIVDPSTLTVELNPDIKFTDGTAVDAAAVKFTIERNIKQGKSGSFEVELYQLDTITVDSPLAFTIKLKTPIAGAWYRLLSLIETSPVSPTAANTPGNDFNKKPVGAGPFMLKEAVVENHITLVKNPTYFQADRIRLAGIELVHVTAESAGNAARSKTVDLSANLQYSVASGLAGSGLKVAVNTTDNVMLMGHICKSRPPFNDIRVRQAINYALDREALNSLYDGKGEPMWGFFAKSSPLHNADLDNYYKRDLTKAKQLLSDAGYTATSKLAFDMYFTPGLDGQRAGEVVQQQLAEAGVAVTLKPLTVGSDFFPEAKGAPINFFPLNRSGLNKVTRVYVPGSFGNVCGWDDPELNRIVKALQAVQETSPEGIKLWKELQAYAMKTAVTIFGIFGVQANVWDDAKLGDVDFFFPASYIIPDFYRIYVKG